MAYSDPKTWADNDALSAVELNRWIRDQQAALKAEIDAVSALVSAVGAGIGGARYAVRAEDADISRSSNVFAKIGNGFEVDVVVPASGTVAVLFSAELFIVRRYWAYFTIYVDDVDVNPGGVNAEPSNWWRVRSVDVSGGEAKSVTLFGVAAGLRPGTRSVAIAWRSSANGRKVTIDRRAVASLVVVPVR